MKSKCLLIIDPQNDFVSAKGGRLSVKGAEDIMTCLANHIKKHGNEYTTFVVTCDFHPLNHCSFKGNKDSEGNEGQWPMHCIQNSWGAAIFQPIMEALETMHESGAEILFITKGKNPNEEEYSAFKDGDNVKQFNTVLSLNSVEQIDVCGVAGDYCVANSIQDLCKLGYKNHLFVMQDFCPSIDDGSTLAKLIEESNLNH